MFHVKQSNVDIHSCPACGSSELVTHVNCRDYTVSQLDFTIKRCSVCGLGITTPRPGNEQLGDYYKSDDYVSHSNSKTGLINTLYHLVRSRTLKQKVRLIKSINQPDSILDFGAGTGAFLNSCLEAGLSIRGAEPDKTAIANQPNKVRARTASPEAIFMENEKFDVITLWHVLEHLPELNADLERLKEKLTYKGQLVIAVPNNTSFDAKSYGAQWAAWDVPRHLWHFSPKSIDALMKQHGMEVVDIKGMWFDSFYVSMLSEKNRNGSLLRAFFVGLRSNIKARFSTKHICSSQVYIIRPL